MYKKREKKAKAERYIELQERETSKILNLFIEHLKEEHNYSLGRINKLIRKEKEIQLPDYIFRAGLSTLEAVVKYLKERLNLRYKEISVLLNRDERTIWTTYKKAAGKAKKHFTAKRVKVSVPLSIFRNRKLSPLENLVSYLLYSLSLRNHQVCTLLNKKPSTISTIIARILKKNE